MKKKKVFLTGAGSGLGKEACLTLARRGHTVYASVHYTIQIAPLEEIALAEHLDLHVFKLDILVPQDRQQISNYSFDVLICNAAIGDSGSVAEVPIQRIKAVFETNIFAHLELVQLVLGPMILEKHDGRIVFLSSLVGRIPAPFLSPYCASKFAIEAFATCLRQEMKILKNSSIQVCMIEPGAYATGFNKENNEKMYSWMQKNSYFYPQLSLLHKWQERLWNLIEIKPYVSIVKQYIKVVEKSHVKLRYTAPWYQAFLIQFCRFFGIS